MPCAQHKAEKGSEIQVQTTELELEGGEGGVGGTQTLRTGGKRGRVADLGATRIKRLLPLFFRLPIMRKALNCVKTMEAF